MPTRNAAVLESVARRLAEEPQHVLPTLRLLADPDALPDRKDKATVALARRVNADRIAARRAQFRAQALSTGEVREVLGGVSRQAVGQRVANKTLLSLEIAGTSYFPDWQFGPDGLLPGLGRIIAGLVSGGRGALASDALMRTPLREERGRTPAQLLADGDVNRALRYIAVAGGDF